MRLDTAALRRRAAEHDTGSGDAAAPVPVLLRPLLAPPAGRRGAARTAGRGGRAASATAGGPSRAEALRARLDGLDAAARRDELLTVAQAELAGVLGFAERASVDPGRSFREIGLDSLTAVELRNRLAAVTGLRLPPALVFDHPDLDSLAGRLVDLLATEGQDDAGAAALSGIDALDRAVRAMAADDLRRDAVRRRLTELLDAVGDASRDPSRSSLRDRDGDRGRDRDGDRDRGRLRGAQPDPELLGRLDAASDDDLFAFIEDQL
jgi:tylactone synthase/type I polyketide synthase PikAI